MSCKSAKQQSIAVGNECSLSPVVDEEVDGWLDNLPGRLGDGVMPGVVEKKWM